VCLNVNSNHLEIFGSRGAIYKAKLDILKSTNLKKGVVFHDDPKLLENAKHLFKDLVTFGRDAKASVRILDATSFAFQIGAKTVSIDYPFFYEPYQETFAAALAVGLALGLPLEGCAKGLSGFRSIPGRFFVERLGKKVLVDDAYNAAPESMAMGLRAMQQFSGKKLFIVGDMLELGPATEESHKHMGRVCAELKPECLVTIGDKAETIYTTAKDHVNVMHFKNTEAALEAIRNRVIDPKNFDVIYLKASRLMGLERLIPDLKSEG
jgi:UDP-N-acetylmuramoyl-tripeptide--D-alanyl-D-alanine ligase